MSKPSVVSDSILVKTGGESIPSTKNIVPPSDFPVPNESGRLDTITIIDTHFSKEKQDSIAFRRELQRQQMEALRDIEVAKAERVVQKHKHLAAMERDEQQFEYSCMKRIRQGKIRTLDVYQEAKLTMYHGLIKKLEEQANDSTLSFKQLLALYKKQLKDFESITISDQKLSELIAEYESQTKQVINALKDKKGVLTTNRQINQRMSNDTEN